MARYYLKSNKNLLFEEYCWWAPCIYLNNFNDHSLCNRKWCKPLRCKEDETELPANYSVNTKFRDKVEHAELFEKIKAGLDTYFSKEAFRMCYHSFCMQKNESLNRKGAATAPKDRFYEGTSTLSDHLRMVVIEDSL